MKAILAVSGGIDSMVMLDVIYQSKKYLRGDISDLILAHFDHGTRPSSKNDADFVEDAVVERYSLPIFCQSANLDEDVSEEIARKCRYDYLFHLAHNFAAEPWTTHLSATRPKKPRNGYELPTPKIYTAHHLDDLVESVAINLIRGTGWRGLAVLDTPGIIRPFLAPETIGSNKPWAKKDILKYAAKCEITFRQDPTNQEDKYLRNRVRQKLIGFSDSKKQKLYKLWQRQKELKREIDELVAISIPLSGSPWQRNWFYKLDDTIALELLRAGALQAGVSATRPQLQDFLKAIRTYAPGKYFNLPGDKLVKLTKTSFIL